MKLKSPLLPALCDIKSAQVAAALTTIGASQENFALNFNVASSAMKGYEQHRAALMEMYETRRNFLLQIEKTHAPCIAIMKECQQFSTALTAMYAPHKDFLSQMKKIQDTHKNTFVKLETTAAQIVGQANIASRALSAVDIHSPLNAPLHEPKPANPITHTHIHNHFHFSPIAPANSTSAKKDASDRKAKVFSKIKDLVWILLKVLSFFSYIKFF